jgi:CMP-N-acetylneuraminic acid synthetase
LTVSVEYPFLSHAAIDEAIDTLVIFNSDSVVSVQSDNSIYYQHKGNGMQPILNLDKFTKYEREALYKAVGGLMLTKVSQLEKTKKSISGNVAHILIDNKEAFNISNSFGLEIYRLIESQIN